MRKYRLGFLLLLCWALLSTYMFHIFYGEAKERAIEELNARQMIHARQASRGIEQFFRQWGEVLAGLGRRDDIVDLNETGRGEMELLYRTLSGETRGITRMDETGKIIHTVPYDPKAIGADISAQEHVREILRTRKGVVSDVFRTVQGYDAIAFHVPVFKGNEFAGTIAAVLDFAVVARRYLEDIRIGKTGYAWMISTKGVELYCPVPGHVGNSVFENCKDFPTILDMAQEMLKGRAGVCTYFFDMVREEKVVAVKKHAVYLPIGVGDSFWSIVVASSEEEVTSSLERFKNNLILVIAVLLLGSVLFSYYAMRAWGIIREDKRRRAAENALRESEERHRALFETMAQGVVYQSSEGSIVSANPAAEEILGVSSEEMRGRTSSALEWMAIREDGSEFPGDAHPAMVALRTAREIRNVVMGVFNPRRGEHRWISIHAVPQFRDGEEIPYQVFTTFDDITEQKRAAGERLEMERRLLHAQKLESLGVLAGGIAHDFNNLLAAILGNLDLALLDLSPLSPVRYSIEQALVACRRAVDLTRQMLAYSGKGRFFIRRIDLTALVEENAHLFKTSISKTATLTLHLDPNLPPIAADPGQMQQIIMNLITNASEALEEKVGVISLSTGVQDCDASFLEKSRLEEKPVAGQFVFLEVFDTGYGMDGETMQRLFDPFFTTKFMGRGLGMSAVLGIVRGHKGAILVESELGRGTTIRVLFPVSREDREGAAVAGESRDLEGLERVGPSYVGTVLVVDDEEMVRDLCRAIVERLGLHVLTARNGEEALHVFRQHPDEIVCVVLDLTMPRMDGVSTFRELQRIRPDVKVILSSGYSEQEATQRFEGQGLAGFIQKPYSVAALKTKFESVLKGTG